MHFFFFLFKKEILLKTIMAVHRLAYAVQFGVELKSLILIRLHSDLVVRTVRLCMSPFHMSIDKINMCIRAVYVSGRSDLDLSTSPTECIMSASSVNTALQNGGNSNQFHI